jgi:hypothetical protein
MIATVALWAGVGLIVVSAVLVAMTDGKMRLLGDLVMAVGELLLTVSAVLQGHTLSSCVTAALAAYYFWRWWTGGGGDGMKRRLKKWAKSFGFGPRTAPSTA